MGKFNNKKKKKQSTNIKIVRQSACPSVLSYQCILLVAVYKVEYNVLTKSIFLNFLPDPRSCPGSLEWFMVERQDRFSRDMISLWKYAQNNNHTIFA